jgi:hypothetical protein
VLSLRCLALAGMIALGLGACGAAQPGPDQPEAAPMMHRDALEPVRPQLAERVDGPVDVDPAPTKIPPAPTPSTTTPDQLAPYERKDWPHWIDADRDCRDTRTEVLIAESFEPIRFEDARRCEIASGRWQCPFTGDIVDQAHLLDVDHLVPLANAHRSGGHAWTREQRRRYANDLEHPEHLVAVTYQANRSKGDKGPEAWLPPLDDARCGYVRDWVGVKRRWGLGMSEVEALAVASAQEICAAGGVPELPQGRKLKAQGESGAAATSSAGGGERESCCRVCSKGKACGDGCIAKTSTCSKPPGCACDG